MLSPIRPGLSRLEETGRNKVFVYKGLPQRRLTIVRKFLSVFVHLIEGIQSQINQVRNLYLLWLHRLVLGPMLPPSDTRIWVTIVP